MQIVVSIDGLQPEHDARRTPATYDRILKHIVGHQITVHCTVTRQQVQRDGYLEEFVRSGPTNPDTRQIWVSLYTPQVGEVSAEMLTPHDRERVVAALMHLRTTLSEAAHAGGLIEVYATPPQNPGRMHLRADDDLRLGRLRDRRSTPCQFGGNPDCSQLRLHRVGRPRGGRPRTGCPAAFASARSSSTRCGSAGPCAVPRRPSG